MLLAPAPAHAAATDCAPFSPRNCVMPFPNDLNLTERARTDTGVRVDLPRQGLPANKDGVRPDPREWNRADGFSPGQQIVVRVPGMASNAAVRRSNMPTLDDLGSYTERDAGLVLLDARTGRRQMAWAEVDVRPPRARDRMLLVNPARNLAEGRRYVVVLRGLRTSSGRRIAAPRGRHVRRALDRVRPALRRARISTRDVYMAWDFTVASEESLHGRMLRIRDDAFAQLGDRNLADGRVEGRPPAFTIDSVDENTGDDRIARRIKGTFTVPCYLAQAGCPPGAQFNYASRAPDALPAQQPGNVMTARVECHIPRAALTAPSRIAMYGHGLLGNATQIDEDNIRAMSAEHNITFCATDWRGFSAEDVPYLITVLQNGGRFPAVADRMQQGFLNQLYLGRLMLHPEGLASNPAFQLGGRPLIDTSELFYDSNSQGGILGAALTAIAPDYRRAVLGVPGMRFSVLLYRSVDFDLYSRIYFPAYPSWGDRILGLSILQLLWDRSEPNGWAAHATTDPPPNTPQHSVLLHPVVGDHQVSTWTADVLARTVGASARRPAIADARTQERSQLFGIPAIPRFPFGGSAIVYWDPGADFTGTTPVDAVPPRTGNDSHYSARNSALARRQKAEFLKPGGSVVDVCTANTPCEGADDATP